MNTQASSLDLYKNIPQALVRILRARGFLDSESWDELFRPSLAHLKSPYSLDQMDQLVDRLVFALQNDEGLLIYGDFDLDGSPGVALLYSGLKELGFKNIFYTQPKRLSEGYGFHSEIIKRFEDKIKVILTVDVGITGRDATDYANSQGIDVLITDHHLPEGELPKALALVNPNKGLCSSGLTYLCGTGVAYYVVLAFWMRLKSQIAEQSFSYDQKIIKSVENFDPKSLLDLFVIATITDLVPLVKENRVLVKHGLKVLERTKRKGLRALMQKLGLFGKSLSSQDIAFKLAPKLNALSRMDKSLLPIDVLLCDEATSATRMVDQILSLNSERQSFQKKAELLALDLEFESEDEFSFVYHDTFHKGVIGLVATKLTGVLKKPAFVGSIKGNKISGSARLPQAMKINLVDILSECPSLNLFGGHAQAAGFEVDFEKAENFRAELRSYFEKNRTKIESKTSGQDFDYDIEVELSELNGSLLNWTEKLEPFGMGFTAPIFKLNELRIIEYKILMDAHLKFKVEKGSLILNCIWFNHGLSPEIITDLAKGNVDITGSLEWNEFMGKKSLQFLVKNLSSFRP